MNKKIVNQIERVLEHCRNVSDGYHVADFMEIGRKEIGYYKNQGWVDALNFVINTIENGSPVSDKPLNNKGDE